jgi:gliding motility-associated-like protein
VNPAGDYTVRTLNSVGCPSLPSDTVTITNRPAPGQPSISYTGSTTFCEGDSLLLTSSAGTAYLWSNGETTQDIQARVTGSYTVRVANPDGCFSLPSVPVDITANPLPEKPEITGDQAYCSGDSARLSGPPASSYLWSNGETTASIWVRSGSYALTVTDANGCISPTSDTIGVTENPRPSQPVITPAGPIQLAPGDSVILSSSAATTYLWSPGGETTSSITVRTTGHYRVTVGNAQGCPSDPSDSVTVTISGLEKPVITVTGGTEICEGTAATLSVPLHSAYLWSNGDTTQSIQVAEAGSYTVTVFNEFGGASTPSDPVEISVIGSPVLSLVNKTDVTCHGETSGAIEVAAAGGNMPYAYAWSNGQTGSGLTGIPAGSYLATVTDANGCQDTLTTLITEPAAIVISETITHPTCEDSRDGAVEVSVSGGTPGYTIAWSNTSTGNRTEDLPAGTVEVTVTDAVLCQATESYTLTPRNDLCFEIQEILTPNADGYNDTWEITGLEFYPQAVVEVFDRWGRRVYRYPGNPWPWDGRYDGKALPMDSYHYIIKLDHTKDPIIGNITIVK